LHFSHANGFPPGTYRTFLQTLTAQFHVLSMEARPLWGDQDPACLRHWRELADDQARFVQEMGLTGAIAVGHSLGAVTSLFCAAAHPGLFRALVLIDPVILPAHLCPIWALAGLTGLNRRAALPTRTRRRRMEWPSREVLYRAYRAAQVFARWQDDVLLDYVTSVAEDIPGGGVRLRYPREWEARIFETAPPDSWLAMPRLCRIPLLVLRGQHSTTYTRSTMRWMHWLLPRGTFTEIEGADHFVPMCRSEQAAQAVTGFLARAG
jgi:pimeloyl-ACP methyl ester carboxylesterase